MTVQVIAVHRRPNPKTRPPPWLGGRRSGWCGSPSG